MNAAPITTGPAPSELAGVITALITPCAADGSVDLDALTTLVEFQRDVGVRGLFVLGTAGQGPLLTLEERSRLAGVLVGAAQPELRVIVHVGAMPTMDAERLAAAAAEAGAAAVAAVPPTYYQPDFRSVRTYYQRIARAAQGLPLFAYNNPQATGYDLRPTQARELFEAGTITAVKQASGSVADLHALLARGVPTWMANATLNTAALAMGARGTISTITNVVPELFVALYDAVSRGDLVEARMLQARVDGAAGRLRTPIIGALHAGCTLRGLPGLAPREPLRLPTDEELESVRLALAELEHEVPAARS